MQQVFKIALPFLDKHFALALVFSPHLVGHAAHAELRRGGLGLAPGVERFVRLRVVFLPAVDREAVALLGLSALGGELAEVFVLESGRESDITTRELVFLA